MGGQQRIIQTAFSNGVVSPRALGRSDLDKYKHSAEQLINVIVMPQGALKRRAGSQNVALALGPSRLIPFVFAPGQAYILELGNGLVRFYYASNTLGSWTVGAQLQLNGLPFTLATPYDSTAINLWDIQVCQQGDVMYFFHPQYPVQKIERFGAVASVPGPNDTGWRWLPVTFACPPIDQFDQDISGGTVSIQADADSIIPGAITLVTANVVGTFLQGDVGKMIIVSTGVLAITSVDSTNTIATCNVLAPLLNTSSVASGSWLMRGAPNGYAGFGNLLDNVTPAGGIAWIASAKYGIGLTENLTTWSAYPQNGSAPGGAGGFTKLPCFRQIDVGRYLNVSGAIAIIQSVSTDGASVGAQYVSVPEDTFVGSQAGEIRVSPAPPGAWTMEDPIWFALNNGQLGTVGVAALSTPCYPGVGALFQNRLWVAGTPYQPKTMWGSQSNNYENFAKGTLAGDSVEFSIAGGKLDTIRWISGTPVQGLMAIETDAQEYVASGGSTGLGAAAITPTNIVIQTNSAQGGCGIPPLLTDAQLIYIQRYHTKVFEFSYNIYQQSFASKDLSLFAEHLTRAGIKEIAYQPIPYKIIWMVTFDGRLIGMTYDKNEDVLAWHEHRTGYADQGYSLKVGTGDSYVSVAVIPNPSPVLFTANGNLQFSGDESATYACDLVWTVVQRGANYYVELMNEDLLVDCSSAMPQSAPLSSTSVRDTSLANRTVVAYGKPLNAVATYYPFDTPFGKAATADAQGTLALEVKAGTITGYGLPFQCRVLTIRPEIPQMGTIMGAVQAWKDLFVRCYMTRALYVNGDVTEDLDGWDSVLPSVPADSLEPGLPGPGQNLDQTYTPPTQAYSDETAPLTTDLRVQSLGYDRFGRILITQDQPFPLTILALFGILAVGDV